MKKLLISSLLLLISSSAFAIPHDLYDNFEKLGGDPLSLRQALCFFNKHKDSYFYTNDEDYNYQISIEIERYIGIYDLTRPSTFKRFFVLDLETGLVESYQSGHGIGRDDRKNTIELASYFSNDFESYLTPTGFIISGNRYYRRFDNGVRLHGIQEGINNNSLFRGVVLHYYSKPEGAPKASSDDEDPVLWGPPTRSSLGCTQVTKMYWDEIAEIFMGGVETITPIPNTGGALIYHYSPSERDLGEDYCGHNLLLEPST